MSCPLCQHNDCINFSADKLRTYYRCSSCYLIFVSRDSLIDQESEFKRYEAHENSESNNSYREYLSSIVQALQPELEGLDQGLDFGSGKSLLLSSLLSSVGKKVDSYDIYFHPDNSVWNKNYNFIILSEVIEHLREPYEEMMRLKKLLLPEGKIFVKTKLAPETEEEFSRWFYKRDITHIQFFNDSSLEKLADLLNLEGPQNLPCQDLVMFKLRKQ